MLQGRYTRIRQETKGSVEVRRWPKSWAAGYVPGNQWRPVEIERRAFVVRIICAFRLQHGMGFSGYDQCLDIICRRT